MLCVVPALRALRRHVPAARITLIGLPWAAGFVRRFARYLDDFIAFPGAWGFPEQTPRHAGIPDFLATVRAQRFDLVLQLHGSGALSNAVVADFGAACTAGHVPASDPPAPGRVPWRPATREVERYLDLMAALGVPPGDDALEFPLAAADLADLGALCRELALEPAATVCVHPGARLGSRRWGAARFAAVADRIADRGYRVVLTGAAAEAPLTAATARHMRRPALDLAGRTELGVLAALIGRTRLLVANDTGVSHLADALGTPSVIVSCGGDAERWAPRDRGRHRVLHHAVPCRPCAHAECPLPGHPCARGITVAEVERQALRLLACEVPHGA
jgi:ADP-heptose:LPS heptosyltransferase